MKKIYDYTLGAACVILTGTLIYMAFVSPKTVEIDEKKFACTVAVHANFFSSISTVLGPTNAR